MRRGTKAIGAACIVAASWFVGPALASNLAHTSTTLTGGNAAITACDSDGVATIFTLSGSNVASVTVSGISSGCGNAALSVAVDNGTASSTGTASVPVGGGSVVVTLASSVAMSDSMKTAIVVS